MKHYNKAQAVLLLLSGTTEVEVGITGLSAGLYSVEDRKPRPWPWMNETFGGILGGWKFTNQHTVSIVYSIMWYGYANIAERS